MRFSIAVIIVALTAAMSVGACFEDAHARKADGECNMSMSILGCAMIGNGASQ